MQTVTITKYGMPNQRLTIGADTAEALLEALAYKLGVSVTFDQRTGDTVPCWDGRRDEADDIRIDL